ncbi:hypothetical protein B0H14DRAFT_3449209 [Mycena olivaceomarginata]|nr:hypothetical protein B0H14DRAFT_3449209 [Mycena olivaceomarginata]
MRAIIDAPILLAPFLNTSSKNSDRSSAIPPCMLGTLRVVRLTRRLETGSFDAQLPPQPHPATQRVWLIDFKHVSAFALPFRALALYNTDNVFSAPVGTLLGVERGDTETPASTVHAADVGTRRLYMSPTKSSLPVPVAVYAPLVAGVNVPVRTHSLAVHRVALLPSLSPLSLAMLSSSPIGGTKTVLLLPLLPLLLTHSPDSVHFPPEGDSPRSRSRWCGCSPRARPPASAPPAPTPPAPTSPTVMTATAAAILWGVFAAAAAAAALTGENVVDCGINPMHGRALIEREEWFDGRLLLLELRLRHDHETPGKIRNHRHAR